MAASPTIRLFVSSTFSDLKAERDALQGEVFPRLKQLCLSKGVRFQAIDLRWGISEEAGRDNRTMRICLRELRRCQQDRPKPNFLILLGDRYGWRPLPEIIPATLFEQLEKEIRAKDAKAAKLLTGCYRRDDNAVPPIYELQPRGENANWFEQVEKPLLAALEQASQTLGLDLKEEGVNIGASATEQEIIEGALKVPDAATHVRAFFRTIEGLPNPAPEDFVETGEAANRLNKLKDRIAGHIGDGNVCRYSVPWRGDRFHADDLKEFCEQAWKQLSAVVEQQIAALAKVPPDEQEEQAHQDFGKERCRHFVGRGKPLERIAAYLREGSGKPLAVIGPSGSGKSAVMAKAVEGCQRTEAGDQKSEIISRFIGATPSSSDLIQLLRNLVGEIRKRYPAPVRSSGFSRSDSEPGANEESEPPEGGTPNEKPDSEIPFECNPLIAAFHEALKRPTADRPLFLFLDALDQLTASHNAHSLAWLPGSLNPHVRLIVSAALPTESDTAPVRSPAFMRSGPPEGGTPNDPRATIMAALTLRLDAGQRVTLAPLTVADAEQMLTNRLADAHRTLQPAQRQAIVETFKAEGSPLWLRTATEEAARLASWQPAPTFSPTTPGLLGQVLDRLSREEEHGDKLVSRTLSYLACARHGLAEDEILDILSADKEVMDDFRRRSPNSPKADSLPVAVWVRLHGDLAFYLAEHQAQGASLLGFYHRSFLEAVTAHCFASRETRETRHRHLAKYFHAQDYFLDSLDAQRQRAQTLPPAPRPANIRKAAELPWQRLQGKEWNELETLSFNPPFLEAKITSGLIHDLIGDFVRTGQASVLVPNLERTNAVLLHMELLGKTLANVVEMASVDPSSVAAQLHLELQNQSESGAETLRARLEAGLAGSCWLKKFAQHGNSATPYLAQTALREQYLHTLQFSENGSAVVFANWSGKLTRWRWQRAESSSTSLPSSESQKGFSRYGAMVSKRRFILANEHEAWLLRVNRSLWDDDLTEGVWEKLYTAPEGTRIRRIGGSPSNGYGLIACISRQEAFLLVYSCQEDGITDKWLIPLPDPAANCINHIAIAGDGKAKAICFGTGEILLSSGIQVMAHPGGAYHCEFVQNNSQLASCGEDGTCAIWDLQGSLRRRTELVFGSADCLAYHPPSNLLVVGHRTGFVSYFTLAPEEQSEALIGSFFPGVYGWVLSLAFSACGSRLAVAGRNGVVRVLTKDAFRATKNPFCQATVYRPVWQINVWHEPRGCFFLDGQRRLFSTLDTRQSSHLPLRCLCFCTDSVRRIVFAAMPGEIRVLRADTGESITASKLAPASRISMTLNALGSTLAVLERSRIVVYSVSPESFALTEMAAVSLDAFLPNDDSHLPMLRDDLPITFCAEDYQIAIPLERFIVIQMMKDSSMRVPSIHHSIALVDMQKQFVTLVSAYEGFCTALTYLPSIRSLAIGIGDQYLQVVHHENSDEIVGSTIVMCPTPSVILQDLETKQLRACYRASAADRGVTSVAIDHARQLLAVTFQSGRIRCARLDQRGWICSVCLDYPAKTVAFANDSTNILVTDDGTGTAFWPMLHEFGLYDHRNEAHSFQ